MGLKKKDGKKKKRGVQLKGRGTVWVRFKTMQEGNSKVATQKRAWTTTIRKKRKRGGT